jgi:hypothetical protein
MIKENKRAEDIYFSFDNEKEIEERFEQFDDELNMKRIKVIKNERT